MGDPIINAQVDDINTTLGNIKVDLAALRPSIRAIKDAIAETYLTDTIENVPIASFNDGADEIPVRELQVAIEPIQSGSGDPSPSNIRPILGHTEVNVVRTGKNLASFNASGTSNGVTFTNTNGVITTSGTATNNALFNSNVFAVNVGDVLYLEGCPYGGSSASYRIDIRDGATSAVLASGLAFDIGSGYELTIPNGTTSVKLAIRIATSTNTSGLVFKPVICYKSTRSTYPISLGQTVYGGTLNVTTGELVVNRVKYSNTWGNGASATNLGSYTRKVYTLSSDIKPVYPVGSIPQICTCAPFLANYSSNSLHFYATSTYLNMFLPNSTANDFAFDVVWELATPTTVQLTAAEVTTLFGANNVWADSGNIVKLTYRKAWEIALAQGE